MFQNYDVSSILRFEFGLKQSRNRIPDRWCIIHTFLLISTPDIRLALLLRKEAHKSGT